MLRTGAIGLGAALAMTLTAAAQAQTSTSLTDGRTQTVVKVQDLNPATTTGSTTLRMRLLSAAKQVCGPRPQNPVDLTATARFRTCVQETYTAALAAAPSAQQLAASKEAGALR